MFCWKEVLIGLAIAPVLAALAVARVFFVSYPAPSHLTVINRSTETVSDARMRQGDHELVLGAIAPGQTQLTDFIAREGPLTLTVTFASGGSVSTNDVGYLAAGIPVIVVFKVADNDVTLISVVSRRRSPYAGH